MALNNCSNDTCKLHETCKRFLPEDEATDESFVDFQPYTDPDDDYTTCAAYLPGKYCRPKKHYCDSGGCNTCQDGNCRKCDPYMGC